MVLEHVNLSRILETAVVAARLAGQRAMEEMDFLKVDVKNGAELVTQADQKCQTIIIDRIKETYPDHGFIAEEGTAGKLFKQTPRGQEQIWWVIDPIDGTNNFAHKMPIFTVSIAAMYEGAPIAGVVFDPATDSMFTAVKDGKAQLNGRRITASEDEITKFSSITIDSHFGDKIPKWAYELILKTRFRNLGTTALHLAYVASGALIGSIVCGPKLWDIAAGAFIAESAGAVITNHHNQKLFPIDLENYNSEPMGIVAANKKIHAELIDLIKASE